MKRADRDFHPAVEAVMFVVTAPFFLAAAVLPEWLLISALFGVPFPWELV